MNNQMVSLKRIYDRIDLIPDLIRQVEKLKPVPQQTSTMPILSNQVLTFSSSLTTLEENIKTWYTDTNDIFVREIDTDN